MLAIVAILIAIWFYNAAKKARKGNVWSWVAIGVIVYYVSGALWVYGILPTFMDRQTHAPSLSAGVAIELSGIMAGLLVVILIWYRFLRDGSTGNI